MLSTMMAIGGVGAAVHARPAPTRLYALQTADTGRLVGTVSSADGVVTGASVEVTDNQSGKKYTATTDADEDSASRSCSREPSL